MQQQSSMAEQEAAAVEAEQEAAANACLTLTGSSSCGLSSPAGLTPVGVGAAASGRAAGSGSIRQSSRQRKHQAEQQASAVDAAPAHWLRLAPCSSARSPRCGLLTDAATFE